MSKNSIEAVEHKGGQSTEAQPRYTEHPEDVKTPAGLYTNTPTSIDEPTGDQRAEDEKRQKSVGDAAVKKVDEESEADKDVEEQRKIAKETAEAEAKQVAEDAKKAAEERQKAIDERREVREDVAEQRAVVSEERREARAEARHDAPPPSQRKTEK